MYINRRQFLRMTSAFTAASVVPWRLRAGQDSAARHFVATVVAATKQPIPEDQRVPFGWSSVTVSRAEHAPLILAWPELPADARPTHFRLSVALHDYDNKIVEAFLPKSGRVVGTMDLRAVTPFQPYQLPLTAADGADLRREGLGLRLISGHNLEIFECGDQCPDAFRPGLLVPGSAKPIDEFFLRLNSLASLQPFGWMEGCVLEGLLDLSAIPRHAAMKEMAREHLALFRRGDRFAILREGAVYGVERTLPFAALARLEPGHPLLETAVQSWEKLTRTDGLVSDGSSVTSEGSYTIAYPMALIAKARGSEELAQRALDQLRFRQRQLFDGKEFYRGRFFATGQTINRNWSRGVAWQILGLARTLTVVAGRPDTADLVTSLQQLAAWTIERQRADGLWGNFVDEAKIPPDTSGSAGIAAALAVGVNFGWLGADARQAAQRTLAGLLPYLTPDGFLDGVAQANKNGTGDPRGDPNLQGGAYRVIFPMAMGLMGQLAAALDPANSHRS